MTGPEVSQKNTPMPKDAAESLALHEVYHSEVMPFLQAGSTINW
jgi:hypothetical protein